MSEKVFEHYLHFPQEIRQMVIDEMSADDRCRFIRCSKLCKREVKSSKNYIYEIKLSCNFSSEIKIEVVHGAYRINAERIHGYILSFSIKERSFSVKEWKYYLTCSNLKNEKLWKVELNKKICHYEHAIQKYKELLQSCARRIKKLVFEGWCIEDLKWKTLYKKIDRLTNLECLEVSSLDCFHNFISKTRGPLKELIFNQEQEEVNIADFEGLYQIQNVLVSRYTKLTKEQFLQLTAPNVHINIGDLTEMDIFNFIRSWQNGTIGINVECYRWRTSGSKFDVDKFLEWFGGDIDTLDPIEIEHFNDAGKRAELEFNFLYMAIQFHVIQ